MAERVALINCPVCLASEDVILWAVSECGHPVCYVCCTRMRVLGDKKDCSVCRKDTNQVLFCKDPAKYADLLKRNQTYAKKYGILFEDKLAKDMFHDLQKLVCVKCKESDLNSVFVSMAKLKEHLRQEHDVQLCKLCLQNTDLFIFERVVYTRPKMAAHVRTGDGNGAYKGHPMCKFCDERFYDPESLNFHVKKNHFWCHFCENDGKFDFYPKYSVLKAHFKKEHFLCEIGECVDEKFVNAFRGKVDLQAHVAKQHTKDMGKQEARQAKQIDLGFNYGRNRSSNEVDSTVPSQHQHIRRIPEDPEALTQDSVPTVKQTKKNPSQDWPLLDISSNGSTSNRPAKAPQGVKPPPGFSLPRGAPAPSRNPSGRVGAGTASSAPRAPPPGLTPVSKPSLAPTSGPPPGFVAAGKDPPDKKKQPTTLMERLSKDSAKVAKFKAMSNAFLRDEMSAHGYYWSSSDLFGDDWSEMFEDCMCGLPNMSKRSELRLIHINSSTPAWPQADRPPHIMTYTSNNVSRKGNKKSKGQRNGPMGASTSSSPGSHLAWGLSGGRSSTQSSSKLNESEYPSLSTAAKEPCMSSAGPSSTWSNRLTF